jgi:hypothetical protein
MTKITQSSPDIADITMQDVRLVCGEGKLENRHVLNAVNVIIKRRAEMATPSVPASVREALERFAERADILPKTAQDSATVHFRLRDCRAARAALASLPAPDVASRNAVIEECAKAAEGPLYKDVYRGRAYHNWMAKKQHGADYQYGNGRHDAAADIRALVDVAQTPTQEK